MTSSVGCYDVAALQTFLGASTVTSVSQCIVACPQSPYVGLFVTGGSTATASCDCISSQQLPLTVATGCISCLGSASCGPSANQVGVYAVSGGGAVSTSSVLSGSVSSSTSPTDSGVSLSGSPSTSSTTGLNTTTEAGTSSSAQPQTSTTVVVVTTSQTSADSVNAQGTTAAAGTSSFNSKAAPTASRPPDNGGPYANTPLPPLIIGLIVAIAAVVLASFLYAWIFVVHPRRRAEREKAEELNQNWAISGASAAPPAPVASRAEAVASTSQSDADAASANIHRSVSNAARVQAEQMNSPVLRSSPPISPTSPSAPSSVSGHAAGPPPVANPGYLYDPASVAAAAHAHAAAAAAAAAAANYGYGYPPTPPINPAVDPATVAYYAQVYDPAATAAAAAAHAAASAHAAAAAHAASVGYYSAEAAFPVADPNVEATRSASDSHVTTPGGVSN
ncbi:hypothetical protein DFJ73DRAFT_837939 [Zopfochytrium polystomum]|nr:hypothetical protein DFJ73DRAFT_837939 [Zopfochytrium polystomum]